MCRVYPHMKRSVLQLILHGCHGDVIQAIEQVKRTHGDAASQVNKSPEYPMMDLSLFTSRSSAFSPLVASLGLNPALLRYAYANATAGGSQYPFPSFPPLPGRFHSFSGLSELARSHLPPLNCQCILGKQCTIIHPDKLGSQPSIIELPTTSDN